MLTIEDALKNPEILFKAVTGYAPRPEYQTSILKKLIDRAFGEHSNACTVHIGCGGGKTKLFTVPLCYMLLAGKATRVVVVAPTIVLTRQQEDEMYGDLKRLLEESGIDKDFHFVNVSSQKTLEDEAIDSGGDVESALEADKMFAEHKMEGITRETTMDRARLKKLLKKDNVVFFVCLKSFIENFIELVQSTKANIDVTVFDEYHRLVSQNTRDLSGRLANTQLLVEYQKYSRDCWNFSASKRRGKVMSWHDAVFGGYGGELSDVKTKQLVDWNYLVKHLKVLTMTVGQIRGISDAVAEHFKRYGLSCTDRFFKEMMVLLSMLRELRERGVVPQVVVFGSRVILMKKMMECTPFKAEIEKIWPGLEMFSIFGETADGERDVIMTRIKSDEMVGKPFILLSHSAIKEGVNVTRFNAAVVLRGMCEIDLQQAVGRIQRTYDGKDTSYLFTFIDHDDADQIKKAIGYFALNLHYVGVDGTAIEDFIDELVGSSDDDDVPYIQEDGVVLPLLLSCTVVKELVLEAIEEERDEEKFGENCDKLAAASTLAARLTLFAV